MAYSIGTHVGALRPVLTVLTLVAGFTAVYFFAFVIAGAGQRVPIPVRPVASYDVAPRAHCAQFVELARAKFGSEWKRRLDPGDTVCAQQIQQAWERDWNPREPLLKPGLRANTKPQPVLQTKIIPQPVLQPKIIASTVRPSMVVPQKAGPAHAKTYSLSAVTVRTPTPPTPRVKKAPTIKPTASSMAIPAAPRSKAATAAKAHDARSFSPSDDGADNETDALNSAQSGRRNRYEDDVLRPRDDSVDEYDSYDDRDDEDEYDSYDEDDGGDEYDSDADDGHNNDYPSP
jgi:hypothetical protein